MKTDKTHTKSEFKSIVQAKAVASNYNPNRFQTEIEVGIKRFDQTAEENENSMDVKLDSMENEAKDLAEADAKNQADLKTADKKQSNIQRQIEREERELEQAEAIGFWKVLLSKWKLWLPLHLFIIAAMGTWTHAVYVLIRGQVVDLSNMVMGLIEYYFHTGISWFDFGFIIVTGCLWAFLFSVIYIFCYYRHHIQKNSNKWWLRSIEWGALLSMVSFEVWLSYDAVMNVLEDADYNYADAQMSWEGVLREAVPLVIAFIVIHFIYVALIKILREAVKEESGEPFRLKKRNIIKKLEADKNKLEAKAEEYEKAIDTISTRKEELKQRVVSFLGKSNSLTELAEQLKYQVEQAKYAWLERAEAHYIDMGKSSQYGDYKLIIQSIADEVKKAIDKRFSNYNQQVEKCRKRASELLEKLRDGTTGTRSTKFALPTLIFLLIMSIASIGCEDSNNIFEDSNVQDDTLAVNVIVLPDLSNRYLQYDEKRFFPVEADLWAINRAYDVFSTEVINGYKSGIPTAKVSGNFCLLPLPMPHDLGWNISGMGTCVNISELPLKKRWDYLVSQGDSVLNHAQMIYDTALNYKPKGVDIWSFFADDFQHYLKKSDSSKVWKNKVILLTDGYLYFDSYLKDQRKSMGHKRDYLESSDMDLLRRSSDWQKVFEEKDMGFLPTGKQYENTEVLMIGLNPPKPYRISASEMQIIQMYWQEWFNEMGIEKAAFLPLNSPATATVIQQFITEK